MSEAQYNLTVQNQGLKHQSFIILNNNNNNNANNTNKNNDNTNTNNVFFGVVKPNIQTFLGVLAAFLSTLHPDHGLAIRNTPVYCRPVRALNITQM